MRRGIAVGNYHEVDAEQKEAIAILVREERKRLGLSQKELAMYLGYQTAASVGSLEQKRYKYLRDDVIDSLERAFNDSLKLS